MRYIITRKTQESEQQLQNLREPEPKGQCEAKGQGNQQHGPLLSSRKPHVSVLGHPGQGAATLYGGGAGTTDHFRGNTLHPPPPPKTAPATVKGSHWLQGRQVSLNYQRKGCHNRTMLTARACRHLPVRTLQLKDHAEHFRILKTLSMTLRRSYASEAEQGNKAVLVTGCDSGFGFTLAKHLHSKGFTVFAGCLFKDKGDAGVKELDNLKSDRLKTLQLNVVKQEEIEKAVEIIRENLQDPEKGLWGVVNNAGISTFGEVEFTSMETYKEVAEVNLWGTVRVTKACLPLIRRAKGRVVNISSMLGRMSNPARSPYCITKFGVEAFSDCLRYEMHPLGVKVSVVEPGNFIAATSLYSPEKIKAIGDKMWEQLTEEVKNDYGRKYFDEKIACMHTYCKSGSTDTSPVINDVTHALTASTPYTRYHPMDYYWWLRMQIMTHMPGAISDKIYIH
ncbi:D-beta-hydroxybutyrate dehydrogenase, mitochondrial [Pelobates cultripes]|uniref:D-beta-hydroxybutyrate dehydrogenase, mitochondrial n=2 Tax=Pelobates cultripes TaxID=61616 RepID=A0AAD1RCN0_PELCU|nr:D-beta-hydroxybutyrate dehydrogenase, mitochondrial [Pelobates cultripes]